MNTRTITNPDDIRPGMCATTPFGITYQIEAAHLDSEQTPRFQLTATTPVRISLNTGTARETLTTLTLLGAVLTDPHHDTPQTYLCLAHSGHYLRGCSVVKAHTLNDAYALLDRALTEAGLDPWLTAPYTLTHLPDDFVGVRTLFNGDY